MRGLSWLARVGPCPIEAWAIAMRWGRTAAYSHAERLEGEGFVRRVQTVAREQPLLLATRRGVSVAGVNAVGARPPAPTWWAHAYGCAWTAAWLTGRGRMIQGPQEVAADESWSGEVCWQQRNGQRRASHRPDLAWLVQGQRVAIEVELARKSSARLEAILALHSQWLASGQTAGVIYVCGNDYGRRRVVELADAQGLAGGEGRGLRVELLSTVVDQARKVDRVEVRAGSVS
jgi:hypothetical protein